MKELQSEQRKYTIGNITVGGVPGKDTSVLVGSIFYHRQRSLKFKSETGEFRHSEAERLIKVSEEFSDKTGLPCMLDVILPSEKWVSQVLDFVASVTDMPILLDGGSAEIRIAALEYADQSGIKNKCVYNSLNPQSKEIEFAKIEEIGLEAAVLLAYNTKDMTLKGRIDAVKQLLPLATQSGVEKALIDTCVLDVPTLGSACKAISALKNELGYPTGCGAHNAIGTWKGLKTKMGRQAIKSCVAVASTLTIASGADYVLYGPIEYAPYAFPAVAMVNAAFAQLFIEDGDIPPKSHPIFKIG